MKHRLLALPIFLCAAVFCSSCSGGISAAHSAAIQYVQGASSGAKAPSAGGTSSVPRGQASPDGKTSALPKASSAPGKKAGVASATGRQAETAAPEGPSAVTAPSFDDALTQTAVSLQTLRAGVFVFQFHDVAEGSLKRDFTGTAMVKDTSFLETLDAIYNKQPCTWEYYCNGKDIYGMQTDSSEVVAPRQKITYTNALTGRFVNFVLPTPTRDNVSSYSCARQDDTWAFTFTMSDCSAWKSVPSYLTLDNTFVTAAVLTIVLRGGVVADTKEELTLQTPADSTRFVSQKQYIRPAPDTVPCPPWVQK